jgi:hypothetical protein
LASPLLASAVLVLTVIFAVVPVLRLFDLDPRASAATRQTKNPA